MNFLPMKPPKDFPHVVSPRSWPWPRQATKSFQGIEAAEVVVSLTVIASCFFPQKELRTLTYIRIIRISFIDMMRV